MSAFDRRAFLKGLAGAGAGAVFPESIMKALAIEPNIVSGSIQDVKHVVILMQENRSFDHYFGTLRGVRGFRDPRAVRLANGTSVFEQPNQNAAGVTQNPPTIFPFRPVSANLGSAFIGDLAHSWKDAHQAWNNGNNDQWIRAKASKNTMAYLQRSDMPYYYMLADAFTICDNYFCSTMTSTDPNRYYMWSGWCGQNGSNDPSALNTGSTPGTVALATSGSNNGNGVAPHGPVVTNAEVGYNWLTYPERLQSAGVTWRIYQDSGVGLNAAGSWGWTGSQPYIGNYGDNALLYFLQYQNAAPGSPLYAGARTGTAIYNPANNTYDNGTLFDQFRADVLNNTLPQVSWIVAPEAYSEHPNWPVNYGAWYVSNVLSALTANPALFASTVFIVNFDENDGFFDHIVAPTPPMSAAQGKSTVSTVNEIYPGTPSASFPAGPYGLGARVPAFVISPWSKGGWVCSEVFDHTSTIRFLEQRFGVIEPNLTPWRRAVCGDLTSALDFTMPVLKTSPLPSTDAYAPPSADIATEKTYPNLAVVVPPGNGLPGQEPGYKPSRALPYRLQADGFPNAATGTFMINFANAGGAGAWFQVRTLNSSSAGGSSGPWGYTVGAGSTLNDVWTAQGVAAAYDLAVHGPNGFYRKFSGALTASSTKLAIQASYVGAGISLAISNMGANATTVTVTDQYTGAVSEQVLAAGAGFSAGFSLQASRGWYDLMIKTSADPSYLAQYAGNVETGQHGTTDPYL